eukprot:CAMPEP_0116023758 /NCGR_PEP_ID=MMETSP0321-20121206/11834_1 /TAXON_ID=163516 /ORGANISM="Leptocylindrus danicus var. danicus, Strain B650" /LENGTH=33 /DNA_ID= /DNA_START= /DNA_END= /DNA_ORIENTATION=
MTLNDATNSATLDLMDEHISSYDTVKGLNLARQ